MSDIIVPDTTQRTEAKKEQRSSLANRLGEVAIFAMVVLATSLAMIAVAIAAPVILALTTISGLVAHKQAPRGWRPAGA